VVKLLDFGLVKPIADDSPVDLTTEGAITGSPLYMSPEQATGDREADARSDIYSLGAVGYYLLTGRPPFVGDKPIKVMVAHIHEDVVPPSHYRPGIPPDLEQVILRCLAKSPEDRFPDAASLGEALGRCEAADGWSRDHAARWWRSIERRKPNRVEVTV
jgi:serine/threonine-protein kinase